jgi:DNA-binding NarL/FixJ family response regulator
MADAETAAAEANNREVPTVHAARGTSRITGPTPVQCLAVAEARLVAEALGAALAASPEIEVVRTCQVSELPSMAREHGPSVVVLRQRLPAGAVTVRQQRARCSAEIVVVGVGPGERELAAWARAGAIGCLADDASLAELQPAVTLAAKNLPYCSPSLLGTLFAYLRRVSPDPSDKSSALLTKREREIYDLLREGMSNKEIAAVLSLRVPTVKNHVHQILGKLGAHRRAELLKFAL